MSEDIVKITVDGQELEARKGQMLIEVTDAAGISIPRFCYHPKLSIAANCRMCLVDVERAPKPLPACATPVTDGMKVQTRSQRAVGAQKGTMEFLLINHPLDCPICDQGGECELQDLAMGYGSGVSRFTERKRVVKDKDIGPLISTEMTRCIHCTRCVRFGTEIAGMREMGATGRGEHMEIGTYIAKSIGSELSGNVIDLCPVGALTNKPARYSGRSWEYVQHASVAPHDAIGSNLYIHTIRNRVMRVVPRDNEEINETWIADRDRFSVEALYSPERLRRPLGREQGSLEWTEALEQAATGLREVIARHGADSVGFLVAPNATLEEMYLAQKLARKLGSPHIDHRLRQVDFSDPDSDPLFPWLGQAITALESVDAALLVGAIPRTEQPLLNHRLRKAALAGGQIMAINPRDVDHRYPLTTSVVTDPAGMVTALAGVAKVAVERRQAAIPEHLGYLINAAQVDDTVTTMADTLLDGKNATVLLGSLAIQHPAFARLRALAVFLAELTETRLGYLPQSANTVGGWLAGAVPHRLAGGQTSTTVGLNAQAMINEPRKAYVLLGIDAEYDCANPAATVAALRQAELVISLSPFATPAAREYAHLILPTATYVETSGTFVNAEGRWQSFNGACPPPGEGRPGWKVLRVLGNLLGLNGFEQLNSEDILNEVLASCGELQADNQVSSAKTLAPFTGQGLMRIGEVPIYALDGLTRRAAALQRTPLVEPAAIRIHPRTAEQQKLDTPQAEIRQNGHSVVLAVILDDTIPEGCAWLPSGVPGTEELGPLFGPIEIYAAQAAA